MRRVTIVQRVLPHYRVAFFERLRTELRDADIELILVVGQPAAQESSKGESATLPWANRVRNRYLPMGRGRQLVWQPAARFTSGSDLVVVEQASRLLLNYWLIAKRVVTHDRLAFWGHGLNLDPHRSLWAAEKVKRWTLRQCDWWFAYTATTKDYIVAANFPEGRVTDVRNSIDTRSLRDHRAHVTRNESASAAGRLSISTPNVALYVGSLYRAKRLTFLVEAADLIREQLPDFILLIAGDGPDRALLEQLASTRAWIRVVGQKSGKELAEIASISKVLVMPGLVGLAVLDSFALELPMVTTAVDNHSPEVSYLIDGVNGAIVSDANSPAAYAHRVIALLTQPDELERLQLGCRESADAYSIEDMASRFARGIVSALQPSI